MRALGKEVEMRAIKYVALVTALLMLVAVPASAMPEDGVPIKGYLVGQGDFRPGADPFTGAPCFTTFGSGSGTMSHMGRTRLDSAHCTPEGLEPVTGKATLTAANGDELVLVYTGPIDGYMDLDAGEVWAVYAVEVLGEESTGRFEGAEGSLTWRLDATFESYFDLTWPAEFRFEGRIEY